MAAQERAVAGGKQIGRVLKEEGVEFMFGLQGGHIWSILVGAGMNGVKMVHFRHEQAGGYAADAYARASGKVGICFGTAGPGMSNQASAIAQAYYAKSPVVALYGAHGLGEDGRGALQEGYAEPMLSKITKWTRRVASPNLIAFYTKKAIRDAMTYPQGPVALEFPIDVQLARTTFSQQFGFIDNSYPEPAPPAADADSVEKAVKILLAAERPVIAGGEAVFWSHAEDELKEFVELTKIPVITRRVGRGAVPEDSELAFSGRARGAILRASDVACTVGLNLGYLEGYGAWAAKTKLIQITESRGDIEFTAKSEMVIIASPKQALRQMIDVAQKVLKKNPVKRDAWLKQVSEIKTQERKRLNDEAEKVKSNKPLHPSWVAQATCAALDKDATIILDAYTASAYFTERFLGNHSASVLDAGTVAGIGHGVAMAVGAQLAKPGQQVLAVMGDGGMGLGGMDVETAVRVGTPVVYLVNNNSDYIAGSGPLFLKAVKTPGKVYASAPWGISPTNYAKMFEACGANGIRVEDPDKLTRAVKKAFNSGKATVLDVVTDNRIGPPSMGVGTPSPKTVTGFMSFFDPEDFNEPLRSILYPPKK